MRILYASYLPLLFAASVLTARATENTGTNPKNVALSFTENKGQFADQNLNPRPDILFGGNDGRLSFYITKKGISYQLYRVDSYKEIEDIKTRENRREVSQQTIYRTDIKWVNANADPSVVTDEALPGHNNYYLQQCPNGALNVKSYKGITLQNIYNNIDLHYYENEGQLKCDYIVAPHGDYKQIQLKVEGATLELQNDGSLLIRTPLGSIQEQAPVVYQNGTQLTARYIVRNNHIAFEVDNYNSNYELVIDPVTRLWGTYYGGAGDDLCTSTATDASGNVYIAGHSTTNSGTTIATSGAHQSVFGGGLFDAFLIKFNSSGLRSWGTYYGGTGSDFSTDCKIEASGKVFFAGYTSSSSGISTSGSHQTVYGGGNYDAYLVEFDSNGARSWATYYGGTGTDVANDCSIDAAGNIYLTGYTAGQAGTVIATAGSHQSSFGGGTYDGFLVKFTSSGVRSWATYYGGSGDDESYACATDAAGNVYMGGQGSTSAGTVIATTGSHQSALNGGDDGFLVKFNGSGVRQWATYYGGVGNELVYGCATDKSGNVFLAGHTAGNSGTVIATLGSHQPASGGLWDIFLVKFNSNGVRSWGTYYGDISNDLCFSCETDGSGDVYIVGYAGNSSGSSIATPGSHQDTYGGGTYDVYLAKFRGNGVRAWGTYYGGTGDDSGSSSTVDGAGNVYLVGGTNSSVGTVIATAGSHQSTHGGSFDVLLVRFADCALHTAAVNGTVCAGGTLSLSVTSSSSVNPTYNWAGPNSFTAAVKDPTIGGVNSAHIGVYTVTLNYGVCSETSVVQVNTINPQPTVTVNSGTICSGNSFVILPAGANAYTITGGTFTVSPSNTTSYTLIGSSPAGCVSQVAISVVTVSACVGLNETSGESAYFALVYPNPSTDMFTIDCTEDAIVKVIDSRGRLIDGFAVNKGASSFSTEHLENGVYHVEISGDNGRKVFRVIKQ